VLGAVQGHLALVVKFVQWVLQDKGTTMMRHNVNNAKRAKQQRYKVPLNAKHVMLEHLATPKVFVPNALPVFIKTPKVKPDASSVNWENLSTM
jgi:hypothetical protein